MKYVTGHLLVTEERQVLNEKPRHSSCHTLLKGGVVVVKSDMYVT